MTTTAVLISRLVDHVNTAGTRPPAARAARRWAAVQPALAGYRHPAAVAVAGRAATPTDRDRLVGCVLRVGPGDEWAELTVLAVVAPRLAGIVGNWAAHGVTGPDLADGEADLVTGCWAEVRQAMNSGHPPEHPGLVLVDRAWAAVRDRRVTERRRAGLHDPGPVPDVAGDGDRRPGIDLLAAAIGDAHAAGRVTPGPGRALFLTRIVGLSVAEAAAGLRSRPGTVRALRSRGVHQLGVDRPGTGLGRVA